MLPHSIMVLGSNLRVVGTLAQVVPSLHFLQVPSIPERMSYLCGHL